MVYLQYGLLFLVSLGGMFIHFLKKNIKGETSTEIKSYFHDNFKSTITAVFFTGMAFLTAVAADAITIDNMVSAVLTSGLVGYTFDSMANKWDKSGE